jgi:small nuclear ribonucleoprotein (snRNP)-like protein
MKLYDINSEMQSLMNQTTEDGEISTETLDAIMNLTLTESEKIEGIVNYIKDLQSDAKAIKKEEETLKSRRQTKENKANFLSEYVKNYLINTKRDRFETPKCLLSFRESESVKILDENLIPKKYLFAEYKISVADIRVALKNGKKVKGAILQENKNLQIK